MLDMNKLTYLTNGCSISLRSCKTGTYITLDASNKEYKFELTGIHPFLENKDCRSSISKQTKFFIFNFDKPNDKANVMYGTNVCLMTFEEFFLCSTNSGEIVLERLRGDGKLSSQNLPPNSKLIILDGLNIDNMLKPVAFDDDIVLRTGFGNFMMTEVPLDEKCTNYLPFNCNGMTISEDTLLKLINPDVPYLPDWYLKRKFINYNYTSLIYNDYNSKEIKHVKKKPISNFSKDKGGFEDKLRLMSKSKENQEQVLLEDLLLNFMGFNGEYIRRELVKNSESVVPSLNQSLNDSLIDLKPVSSYDPIKFAENVRFFNIKFAIEPNEDKPTCDSSLMFLINRILPMSVYYDKICNFINLASRKESGIICKALSEGIRVMLREYLVLINDLEGEYISGKIDIQKLFYVCQKPLKIIENLFKLCSGCYYLKGGNLINMIYSFYMNTSDDELKRMYKTLLEKAFAPFMEMLRNWLCSGYLDDCYEEFLVLSCPLFTKENIGAYYNELYWDKKYSLNDQNVPIFIHNMKEKIFFVGKSLILMKECKKLIKCPYEDELNCFIIRNLRPKTGVKSDNPLNNIRTESLKDSNEKGLNKSKSDNLAGQSKAESELPFLSIIDNIDNLNKFYGLINKLYDWANSSLLHLTLQESGLVSILQTAKKMFFMECGDFYSYFLDLLDEFLDQEKSKLEHEKIESIFFTSQSSTSLSSLKFKELFTFCFSNQAIDREKFYLEQFEKIVKQKDLFHIMSDLNTLNQNKSLEFNEESKLLDTLSIDMKIENNLLLSIIFSQKNRTKYQLLFRQLILLKYQEKRLGETWVYQQHFTQSKVLTYLRPSYMLRDKMINFVKNLSQYFFHDIIETNFYHFIQEIQDASTFNKILFAHDRFLDKCMKESFLHDLEIMNNTSKIVQSCLLFSSIINKFYKTALEDENLVRETEIRMKSSRLIVNKYRREQEDEMVEGLFLGANLAKTVDKLGEKFEFGLECFLNQLSKLSTRTEEYLGKLLTRLDYNNYYYERFSKRKENKL